MLRPLSRRLTLVVLLCAAVAPAARAQSPLAIGFEEAFAPDFMRRDLALLRSELSLDDEQAVIVQSLLGDYLEQFDAELAQVREGMRDVQAALGAEDPEIDRQREALRERIAGVFERMQAELEGLPEGESGGVAAVRAKYEAEIREIQAEMEKLRGQPVNPQQERQMFESAAAALEAWTARRRLMRDTFAGDMQAILRQPQLERWPAVDRRLLRERSIGGGRLQGESVDLVAMLRELQLASPSGDLGALVQDYEVQIDAALRARSDVIAASQRELFRAVQAADRAAIDRVLERLAQARIAVRNVNDQFAQAFAAALPAAEAERFVQSHRQRGYPRVFRSTQTQRLIKASRELPNIAPEQAAALDAMLQQYESELATANESLLRVVREHEPAQYRRHETQRLLPALPEVDAAREPEPDARAAPDPIQEAFTQRSEMGGKYDAQLQALLGEDLYDRLPRGDGRARGADVDDQPDDGGGG